MILGSERYSGEGNGNPLQYSCLKNPIDRGSWWATVHGVIRVKHDLATTPPPCSEGHLSCLGQSRFMLVALVACPVQLLSWRGLGVCGRVIFILFVKFLNFIYLFYFWLHEFSISSCRKQKLFSSGA